ncbi:DUF2017 domain-containing protein [Nocardioides mangrovicus]|uniref:DUF2017 domain-containing protein n=1 Tax=Nocardioides mangrovicus TaxID=2478913 RepID=A0A3L8P369_9ACTN|nr:DUF2017 domain-containing protein [Nocardioides mangrovicus]RLV49790.1 DUF2017 domain-containing protein [Nocardioides mangrovicus]
MTHGFSRHRRTRTSVAVFSAFEADLIRSLAGQLVELLRNENAAPQAEDELERMLDFSGPTAEPEDPVLARLFPTAYPEDEEAAGEFRRFTEGTLRDGKAAAAAAVIDSLEAAGLRDVDPDDDTQPTEVEVELDTAAARTWLRSLTDMRLAIGTRLEIRDGDEGDWEDLPDDDPRRPVHDIYSWLGFLQETLVDSISR